MSAWLSIYCRRSIAAVKAADLLRALDLPDPYLEAEIYGIEDEGVVDAAMAQLHLEPVNPGAFGAYRLYYREAPSRPVVIERKSAPDVVQGLVQEVLDEGLGSAIGSGAQRIRSHLTQVQEIVDFELGFEQLADLGLVFSLACARYIAERGEGYLQDQDGVWWDVAAGSWRRIAIEL